MNDAGKYDLRKAGAWLSGEVEIRLTRKWLVGGGVLVAVLLLVALD